MNLLAAALAWWRSVRRRTRCAWCREEIPGWRIPFGSDQYGSLFCDRSCQLAWECLPEWEAGS